MKDALLKKSGILQAQYTIYVHIRHKKMQIALDAFLKVRILLRNNQCAKVKVGRLRKKEIQLRICFAKQISYYKRN